MRLPDDFWPARRGWSNRYAPLRTAFVALVELVVFLTLLFGIPAIIWLAAPQGAGYPS